MTGIDKFNPTDSAVMFHWKEVALSAMHVMVVGSPVLLFLENRRERAVDTLFS